MCCKISYHACMRSLRCDTFIRTISSGSPIISAEDFDAGRVCQADKCCRMSSHLEVLDDPDIFCCCVVQDSMHQENLIV